MFVASHHDSAGNQEFMLVSWKLLLCDVLLALYLLVISLFILLLGTDLTTNVVVNTLFRCGPNLDQYFFSWHALVGTLHVAAAGVLWCV
jgi:hypothetical protein